LGKPSSVVVMQQSKPFSFKPTAMYNQVVIVTIVLAAVAQSQLLIDKDHAIKINLNLLRQVCTDNNSITIVLSSDYESREPQHVLESLNREINLSIKIEMIGQELSNSAECKVVVVYSTKSLLSSPQKTAFTLFCLTK